MKNKLIISIISLTTILNCSFSSYSVYAQGNEQAINSSNSEISDNSIQSWKDNIHTAAQSIIDNGKVTGIQYALIDNGEIVLSDNAGVYSKDGNKKLSSNNMFGIGSVSKMFVTASVMKLVDEGKVELDKPVVDYIPEFSMADERYKKITVRMLLNHSSGLMGTVYKNAFLFGENDASVYTKDSFLEELKTQRLKAEPGEYSVYCNDGFTLAQILVEKISGQDFTSFIHDNFTKPLGIDNIKTPADNFDVEQLAKNYDKDGNVLLQDYTSIIGAGGIYSSAEDLCRFAQIFNKPGILSEKSIKAMEENEAQKGIYPKDTEGSFEFGLGWDNVNDFELKRYGIKGVTKGGDTLLYHGSIVNVPEYNISVAVLSSSGASDICQFLGEDIIKQYLKEKGVISNILPEKAFEKFEKTQMPAEMKEYSGLYMVRGGVAHIDVKDDGEMQIYAEGADESQKAKYYYTSDGYFTNDSNTEKCKFVKESNGHVYIRVKIYTGIQGVSQMVLDYYNAEKVDDNPIISENIKKAWENRNNVHYFLVNEKYTSQLYLQGGLISEINFDDNSHGYVGNNKVSGENNAETILQLPGVLQSSGRDLNDINFYTKDGCEYMKSGSFILISEKNIDNLTADINSINIDESGYAKWFKVSDMDEKEMSVQCPEKGAYAAFDKDGNCLNYSLVSKDYSMKLNGAAYVVFVGDKGSEFKLSFTQK